MVHYFMPVQTVVVFSAVAVSDSPECTKNSYKCSEKNWDTQNQPLAPSKPRKFFRYINDVIRLQKKIILLVALQNGFKVYNITF